MADLTQLQLSLPQILLILFSICVIVGLILAKNRSQALQRQLKQSAQQLIQSQNNHLELKDALASADHELQTHLLAIERIKARDDMLSQQLKLEQAKNLQLSNQLDSIREEYKKASIEWQGQRARSDAQQEAVSEKIRLLEDSEQRLLSHFEQLSQKVFDSRNQIASEQSQNQLTTLLQPFREQLDGFRQLVQQNQRDESTQRALLKQELERLGQLNKQMSDDANRLTDALKGDSKLQGNWGEMILQTILEQAGLREGHEYLVQQSYSDDKGKRYQPDIIVRLPGERVVIVDSKVSLVAYECYFNSQDEQEKAKLMKKHVQSIRGHIRGLGRKDYQELPQLNSLDYVLLFIPIESAFNVAISEHPELIDEAMQYNTLLVSPTNLLIALRTIHNLWQIDYQNQYAAEIAERAGKLYDKFSGFISDLQGAGDSVVAAHQKYRSAMAKLATGKGNLLSQVKMLEQLQIKHQKKLPQEIEIPPLEDSEQC